MSSFFLALKVMSGMTTPEERVLMRIFSSAFSRGVQEGVDVGVVCVQVTAPAPDVRRAGLRREGVFQQLHDGITPRTGLNLLNGRTGLRRLVRANATPPRAWRAAVQS